VVVRRPRPVSTQLAAALLTVAACLWAATVLVVPLRAERLPLASASAYGAGSLVCHQRPERSFHASGTRFPVCARCTGLYLSGALGALAGWLGAPRTTRRTRILLLAAAVPTATTLVAEWFGVSAMSNAARATAAVPLGATAGWLFVRMLRSEAAPSTCAIIS
jgi:uncharacterized membrane protein